MRYPKLKTLIDQISDTQLRRKVTDLLENPTFQIAGKKYSGLSLEESPAGLSHHHNYPSGYIEHITSTMNIALALCGSVEKVYRGRVNRDFVIAGVLLHDIFKPVMYSTGKDGGYDSTQLADYVDHLSLVTSELIRRDFPIELVHIVAAHHGNYGPIRPHTVEALICHLADQADSRLNGEVLSAASYLMRRALEKELPGLNSKEAFEIVNSKAIRGWKGVAKAYEKIKRKRVTRKT